MQGGQWGFGHEGGQAEAIRARFADATLVVAATRAVQASQAASLDERRALSI